MADGTPWKHDLSHNSTISLWVPGAMMNMAGLPNFKFLSSHIEKRKAILKLFISVWGLFKSFFCNSK